jgi:chemotaxis protein CheC
MNTASRRPSQKFIQSLTKIAGQGFQNAAQGLSKMTGVALQVYEPSVNLVPIKDIPYVLGGPENDAVGIYLKVEGEISGHVLLIMPYDKALEMVDLLMDEPVGTTQKLGSLERSALAEVGNLTGTFFINALSDQTGLPSRPSPPAVMVDMVGAILDVITALVGEMGEEVLMFQATFMVNDREMNTDFWVIPDAASLEKLTSEMTDDHAQ